MAHEAELMRTPARSDSRTLGRRFCLSVAAACMLPIWGCTALPSVEFHAVDEKGIALPGVPVVVTTSEHVDLFDVRQDTSPRDGDESREARRHLVEGATGVDGVFRLCYVPPSRPGFLRRLFGAEDVGMQWISLTYRDSSGKTISSKILLVPE